MTTVILADAAVYACVMAVLCMGLTLTYKITSVPNFAHTTFAILGMYMALITTKVMGLSPYHALPLAFAVSGGVALFLYCCIIRVLQRKGASYLALIISTLAFDIFMIGIVNMLADFISGSYHVISRDFTLRSFDGVILGMPAVLGVSLVLVLGLAVGLYFLLYRTRFGIQMRAAIENQSLAQVFGINTNRVFCVSWFLSGGLGGTAGVLMSVWFQGDPSLSAIILPTVFAGSIVGGFSSVWGAILGGAIVGVTEIVGTNALAGAIGYWIVPYRPLIPFLFIIVTLMVSPKGIMQIIHDIRERRWQQRH